MFKAKCDLGIQAPESLNEFSKMETARIGHKDNSIFMVVKALLLLFCAVIPMQGIIIQGTDAHENTQAQAAVPCNMKVACIWELIMKELSLDISKILA